VDRGGQGWTNLRSDAGDGHPEVVKTAPAPDDELAAATVAHAVLQDEARALDQRTAEARRAADVAEWMRLLNRQDELDGLILQARVRLLRAQLEEAWTTVEQRHVELMSLVQARDAAHQTFQDHAENRPRGVVGPPPETAWREWEHASMRLRDAYEEADFAHREALHATVLAFIDIERIEAQVETATGEPPAGGEGLRAPVRRLRATVAVADPAVPPARWTPDSLAQRDVKSLVLLAGTVPPRWAVPFITNPDAWEDGDAVGGTAPTAGDAA